MQEFLESDASGVVVVARLPADIQSWLGAKTTRVFLSSETRDSHRKHGWSAGDFAHLQALLDHGEVRTDRDRHVVVAHLDGKWRYAALKVTEDRREVYLASFRVMRKKQVFDFSRKGDLVRKGRPV
ncbi:hypothetical protein [Azospirillum thermophilum]|uniref:hypothetical protein n=1 Tax=Azospirillum thermophilum TaxID=2202148 RepID=UPI0015E8B0C7|nr:hypothetical protein [Azospirillum thermophilum]